MSADRDGASLYLLDDDLPWWPHLGAATEGGVPDGRRARAAVLRALIAARASDPFVAVADALVYGRGEAWRQVAGAEGVRAALACDVATLLAGLARAAEAERGRDAGVPPLERLAPPPSELVAGLAARLRAGDEAASIVGEVLRIRERVGGGPLGRFVASRWDGRELVGVERPATPDLARLSGLAGQVDALAANTEAFLRGAPAMHALLYGPRGSGKSTVVRGLLGRYRAEGLRLVELRAEALTDLSAVVARLRDRPERFLVFVDDLAFESGDVGYHPLKSLLEGSVAERPDNVRLYATSNRRHLVQERLRDRPDPLDDDVHAWDTHQERLALADRFGLLVTFPSADKARFLAIVRHLAARDEVRDEVRGDDLEQRADRFARGGNGYSGRTAQQFVDAARAGLA